MECLKTIERINDFRGYIAIKKKHKGNFKLGRIMLTIKYSYIFIVFDL